MLMKNVNANLRPAIQQLVEHVKFKLCYYLSAPIVCIVPEPVDFATGPTDGSYNYLDKITYSCNIGYEVQSGNLERICLKDKTWSGSPLSCSVYLFYNF